MSCPRTNHNDPGKGTNSNRLYFVTNSVADALYQGSIKLSIRPAPPYSAPLRDKVTYNYLQLLSTNFETSRKGKIKSRKMRHLVVLVEELKYFVELKTPGNQINVPLTKKFQDKISN